MAEHSELISPIAVMCGVWEHYKGGLYLVLGLAEHTETKEKEVVYVGLTGSHLPGPRIRVRSLTSFIEFVKWEDGFDAPRFRFKGDVPE